MSASNNLPVSVFKLTVVSANANGSCGQSCSRKMTAFALGPSGLYSGSVQEMGSVLDSAIEGNPPLHSTLGHALNPAATMARVASSTSPRVDTPCAATE